MSLVQLKVYYSYYSTERITPIFLNEEDLFKMNFYALKEKILEEIPHLKKSLDFRLTVQDHGSEVDVSPIFFQHQLRGILETSSTKAIEVKALVFDSPGLTSPPRKKTLANNSPSVSNNRPSIPTSKKKLAFTNTDLPSPGFKLGSSAKQDKCSTPFERYVAKTKRDIEEKKNEILKLEQVDHEISLKLLKVRSNPSDGNMCRSCHLRLGHTARNCSYGKCSSVFHCGEEKLHPGESQNRERRLVINKLKSEVSKMERELELKRQASQNINESLFNQIEKSILKENSHTYSSPGGLRNWSLLRKHVSIIETYCKIKYGGKIPPKHKVSTLLSEALEQNMTNETLKQAKSRKNPAQNLLESHGIMFPQDPGQQKSQTEMSSNDLLFRCAPVTKEEENEQLNMVLKQSLLEKTYNTTSPFSLYNQQTESESYHSTEMTAHVPPPPRFYSSERCSNVNPHTQLQQQSRSTSATITSLQRDQSSVHPNETEDESAVTETAHLLLSLNKGFHTNA